MCRNAVKDNAARATTRHLTRVRVVASGSKSRVAVQGGNGRGRNPTAVVSIRVKIGVDTARRKCNSYENNRGTTRGDGREGPVFLRALARSGNVQRAGRLRVRKLVRGYRHGDLRHDPSVVGRVAPSRIVVTVTVFPHGATVRRARHGGTGIRTTVAPFGRSLIRIPATALRSLAFAEKRWDWDSNPGSREATCFQGRRNGPLCHPTTRDRSASLD